MECKAITTNGTQCLREAELGSKYCWQHRNYDTKNNYFQSTVLLHTTLLPYLNPDENLKSLNKQYINCFLINT